ncbi:MAG: DNA/RNA non-specific endonuclease [Bacteroidota bacterium]
MPKTQGYKPNFLGKNLKVALPQPNSNLQADFAHAKKGKVYGLLHYPHHSVQLSKKRKLPVFTAVNIDGKLFRPIKRSDIFGEGSEDWDVDERAKDYQWGDALYKAAGSDYDRGHLVKREDPQWGKTDEEAAAASRATFFYSNSVPQVKELNRKEWRNLEDYILKKQSAKNKLRVTVLTGAVLLDNDPVFVQPVNGETVALPGWVWKVVYYTNDGKTLSRAAFLMGQRDLLLQRGIAKLPPVERGVARAPVVRMFEDYKDATTFQVNIALIEELTGLTFSPAEEPYQDRRPSKIVLNEVEIPATRSISATRSAGMEGKEVDFELEGIVL